MDIFRCVTVLALLVWSICSYAKEEMQLIEILPGEDVAETLREHGIELTPSLSAKEVEASVASFNKATESVAPTLLTQNKNLTPKEIRNIQDYTSNEAFLVTINFKTEALYPSKYRSQNHFIEDTTPEFFEEVSGRIFKELMGSEYAKFEPELIVVYKSEVLIKAHFQDDSQLRELISLPGVISATHYGNIQEIEELSGQVKRKTN